MLPAAVDVAQELRALARGQVHGEVQQDLAEAHDGVERRAQLVRHVGQEFRLVAAGLLELAVDLEDLLVRAPQRRVLAHQVAVGILQPRDQALPLRSQPLLLQVAFQELPEPMQVDRFGDVVVGAAAQRLRRHLLRAVGRHHHDHRLGKVTEHLG